MEQEPGWLKKWMSSRNGGNGEEAPGGKMRWTALDRSIATALVWCMAGLLMLRLRNPELAFVLGALAVAGTVVIWFWKR